MLWKNAESYSSSGHVRHNLKVVRGHGRQMFVREGVTTAPGVLGFIRALLDGEGVTARAP